MKAQIFIMLAVAFMTNSCSSLFRAHCNAVDAYRMGEEDASTWNTSKSGMARGSSCTEEYNASHFQNDYMRGYLNRLTSNCSEVNAHEAGISDGQNENTSKSSLAKFKSCEEVKIKFTNLSKVYEKGFNQSFCTQEKASEKGKAKASAWEKMDSAYINDFCKEKRSSLVSAYQESYQQALSSSCSEISITEKAINDAQAGLNKFDQLRKMEICPKTQGISLVHLYTSSYDKRSLELQIEKERAQTQRQLQELNQKLTEQQQTLRNQEMRSQQMDFYYNGYRFYVYCDIRSSGVARVSVRNPNPRVSTVSGNFSLEYYDAFGRMISRRDNRQTLSIGYEGEASFEDTWAPYDAKKCRAYFK